MYDSVADKAEVVAYSMLPDLDSSSLAQSYLQCCDGFAIDSGNREKLVQSNSVDVFLSSIPSDYPHDFADSSSDASARKPENPKLLTSIHILHLSLVDQYLTMKKKYKPVALKTRLLLANLPEKF